MPLKLDCPRCKQSLAVPTKLAGSYVNCPRCKGRLWIPEAADGGSERGEHFLSVTATVSPAGKTGEGSAPADNGAATPVPGTSAEQSGDGGAGSWAPPLANRSPMAPAAKPPTGRSVAVPAPAAKAPPPAPLAPAPLAKVPAPVTPVVVSKKTARLISAEAAPSNFHLAADGKLPELRLEDGTRTVDGDAKHKAVSPLVLFALLCLSAAVSMVAVMVDFEGPDPVRARQKSETRQKIEMNFFPMVAEQGEARPAEPYQKYLGEAARAHARGDRLTERKMYNKVLDLLRAERDRFQRGLTGSRQRDKELEQLIIVLLGDD